MERTEYKTARSSYFKVNNASEFAALMGAVGVKVTTDPAYEGCVSISVQDGVWPNMHPGTGEKVDLVDLVSEHLVKGQVAILFRTSFNDYDSIDASAVAVNAQGKRRDVRLDHIFDLAQELV